jgi:hypothetical protein
MRQGRGQREQASVPESSAWASVQRAQREQREQRAQRAQPG